MERVRIVSNGILDKDYPLFYLFTFTYEDQQNLLFLCVPLGAFPRDGTMSFAYVSSLLIGNHHIGIFF